MKRKGLIIAAWIVGILLVLAIAAPLVINPEQFRPKIEAMLSDSLARQVKIGALHMSLFSGGIAVDEVAIAEAPDFGTTPFLTAKKLKIGVEMMPLLTSRTLHVRSFTIDSPEVRLLRAANGKWNFSSMGAAGGTKSGSTQQPDLTVDKVRITNGRVVIGRVGESSSASKPTVYDHVEFEAENVSLAASFPFHLALQAPGNGKLKVDGTAGPISKQDVSETPLDAKIAVEQLDLAATGLLDPKAGIGGVISYNGTVKSDGKHIRSTGTGKAEKMRLVATGSPAKLPMDFDYDTTYDVAPQHGTLSKGELRIGGSRAQLAGTYDTAKMTSVAMRLQVRNMLVQDIQNLLPAVGVVLPAGASLQGGTASADLALNGPLDRLLTTGTVNLAQTKLTGFDLGSKLKTLGTLAGVPSGSETEIQLFSSELRVAPEGIRADSLNLVVPALGTLTGNGTIAANNALDFKMVAQVDASKSVLGALTTAAGVGRGTARIPFSIHGTTTNPVFVPDVGGALGKTAASPQKSVGDILGGFLGGKKK